MNHQKLYLLRSLDTNVINKISKWLYINFDNLNTLLMTVCNWLLILYQFKVAIQTEIKFVEQCVILQLTEITDSISITEV